MSQSFFRRKLFNKRNRVSVFLLCFLCFALFFAFKGFLIFSPYQNPDAPKQQSLFNKFLAYMRAHNRDLPKQKSLFNKFLAFKKSFSAAPAQTANFEAETIKTPCRSLSLSNPAFQPAEGKSPQRIDKLTKLMDEPIDWAFKDIQGEALDLYCLRGKKIALVNFWATWCPPCVEELASLSRLAESHESEIFVVAISSEPLDIVRAFVRRSFSDLSPHFKIAQAEEGNKLSRFPADSLPATYIFNKKGLLKAKELGARDWSEPNLVRQILSLR